MKIPTKEEILSHSIEACEDPVLKAKMEKILSRVSSWSGLGYKLAEMLRASLNFTLSLTATGGYSYRMDVREQIFRFMELTLNHQVQNIQEESTFPPFQNRLYHQQPCNHQTLVDRARLLQKYCALSDPILIVGDDDLMSLYLASIQFSDITAIDIDPQIIETLNAVSKEKNYPICARCHDIEKPFPADLLKPFSLLFFDPIYSFDGIKMFLDSALESIKKSKQIYRNNLEDRDFGKEAPQNFNSERTTIAERQGVSENQNSEAKPMPPKTDPPGCFGIYIIFCLNTLSLSNQEIENLQQYLSDHRLELVDFHYRLNWYKIPPFKSYCVGLIARICYALNRVPLSQVAAFPKAYQFFSSDVLVLKRST